MSDKKGIWITVAEGSALLGVSLATVKRHCKANKYTTKTVTGNGGQQYRILLSSLPEEAQIAYQKQQLEKVAETLPAKVAETLPVESKTGDKLELTQSQREIDLAISNLFKYIGEFKSEAAALRFINAGYEDESLPSHLMSALELCKEKNRKDSTQILPRRTLANWKKRFKEQGHYAPKKRAQDLSVKEWHQAAIALYLRPQKPSVQYVVEKLAALHEPAPSYAQVYDFLKHRFSRKELIAGRYKGQQKRALTYYKKRTSKGMQPWDEIHADGWNTHFTAPHPRTGEYVTFEIWDLHDVATRYVPPFGIGLTENYEVIAKAIENAIRDYGVMAILQTDSTKIIKKNKKFTGNPVMSIADRAGVTIVHPDIVGNAQANGIAENFHMWLDQQSRELSTYQAKNMDSLTLRRTKKLTAKLIKAKQNHDDAEVDRLRREIGKTAPGILFESFEEMCDWLEEVRQRWNNHPHSALPKIYDDKTGKKRHMTPNEALQQAIADGWEPHGMDEEHLTDLFRPRVKCRVRRGVVAPYHKDVRFRNHELDHIEGQDVIVSYDIMDHSQVRVMDAKGALICVAQYDELVSYRSDNANDVAQEKRALATIRRLEKKAEQTAERAGLNEVPAIEAQAKEVVEFEPIETEVKQSHEETLLMWADYADDDEVVEKKTVDWSE